MRRHEAIRGNIAVIVVLVLAVGLIVYYLASSENSPAGERSVGRQETPEDAFNYYLDVVYSYLQDEGATVNDVKLAVTDADWEWFSNNYEKLDFDPFDIKGGLDPTTAQAVSKHSALRSVLKLGPHRRDTKILHANTAQFDRAVLTVSYLNNITEWEETDVTVVLEGDKWKVKDFAGGRRPLN